MLYSSSIKTLFAVPLLILSGVNSLTAQVNSVSNQLITYPAPAQQGNTI